MTGAEVALLAAAAPEIAGAAAGATAAGTAAAGAGAAGLAGGASGMMGAGIAGSAAAPMTASLMAPAAATPFFTEAAMAAGASPMMGGGTAAMFGTGAPLMPEMAALSMGAPPAAGSAFKMPPMTAMNAASKMMGGGQQQAPSAQRMPSQAPMSQAEIMQRLKMLQGGRSNFAGLLGQAIGGY